MGAWINRIVLHNYRKFSDYEVDFNQEKNIIVGDNEAGKSSIISAIDFVVSGNDAKVKAVGIDNIFNYQSTRTFLDLPKIDRKLANLPIVTVDLYLSNVTDAPNIVDLMGKFREGMKPAYGLRMIITPNTELASELKEYLENVDEVFPFDFYKVEFQTFGNVHYSGYRKFLRHLVIDNSSDRFDVTTAGFVKDAYQLHVSDIKDRAKLESSYRTHKNTYEGASLKGVNDLLEAAEGYRFGIRSGIRSNLETDLTIYRDKISIDSLGLGERFFIKTKFSLNNKKTKYDPDVVLIEEPENHLSHNMMHKLIDLIKSSKEAQIFISTHSNMISSRLDLRNCIFIRKDANKPISLKDLDEGTAKFFEKAPTVSILDFVLSDKVILVEGAAEYILLRKLYFQKDMKYPEDEGVYVASIGGLSFKRYMEIAKLLDIKTAVIRDNDGDPQKNCIDNYSKHASANIKVFFDNDAKNYTFEKCIYDLNEVLCDKTFASKKDKQAYMLSSKAEAAYKLSELQDEIVIPEYINEAFAWVKS
ncbi:hypothetical protein BGO17_00900 [Candidatus Saccharibacteria bacterium 49-20]|nr:MAG: hypothetical protein BGO17_00900 [Candidatus Saccharibacteria bacterium 49-20]